MDDDLDDIIDILNKNTDKPPLPKPKELITIKEEKAAPIRKYESNTDATCHSGGDAHAGGRLIEETKESTNKKNARRKSAVNIQNSATKQQDQGPSQDDEHQEENKAHSS
jgi:hypothetical protein